MYPYKRSLRDLNPSDSVLPFFWVTVRRPRQADPEAIIVRRRGIEPRLPAYQAGFLTIRRSANIKEDSRISLCKKHPGTFILYIFFYHSESLHIYTASIASIATQSMATTATASIICLDIQVIILFSIFYIYLYIIYPKIGFVLFIWRIIYQKV